MVGQKRGKWTEKKRISRHRKRNGRSSYPIKIFFFYEVSKQSAEKVEQIVRKNH